MIFNFFRFELREQLRQAHTTDAVRALFVKDKAATAA